MIMRLPRPIVSNTVIFILIIVQLIVLATLSCGLLSSAVLGNSARPPHSLLFQDGLIKNSVKGLTSISSWSKIVEFDTDSASFRLVDPHNLSAIGRSTKKEGQESFPHTLKHDLVSPRGWLEYCERTQESIVEKRSPRRSLSERVLADGAYTVLRCDFLSKENSWRIWGKDFHLNRLRESYRLLLQQVDCNLDSQLRIETDLKSEKAALNETLTVMNILLEEAKQTILCQNKMNETFSVGEKDKEIVTAMLTLMWNIDLNSSDASTSNKSMIRVQGHVFSTLKSIPLHTDSAVGSNPNAPCQVVIGHLPYDSHRRIIDYFSIDDTWSDPMLLPNRYESFPRAKLSSWCRRRRLLEEIFKANDVGDVILTKFCEDKDSFREQELMSSPVAVKSTSTRSKSSVELLEGLTSNLFVVYPGKILRTAPSKYVLGGYVRQKIIDCAKRYGYRVEFCSIPLTDSSMWEEVFLTSSIRLIIPIKRLLLPTATDNDDKDGLFDLETLWELHSDEKTENGNCRPRLTVSDQLYFELMGCFT